MAPDEFEKSMELFPGGESTMQQELRMPEFKLFQFSGSDIKLKLVF